MVLGQVGTTAEVVALRDEDEDTQFWGPCLVAKFLGRQRFRLLDTVRRANGCVCMALMCMCVLRVYI